MATTTEWCARRDPGVGASERARGVVGARRVRRRGSIGDRGRTRTGRDGVGRDGRDAGDAKERDGTGDTERDGDGEG